MSNLGFKLAMEREGIELVQTAVGDRYVLEEMKRGGYALGGEQSGHVIVLDHATTGDGTLTGLMLAARVAATGQPLAELAGVMERLPQVLINVPDVDRSRGRTPPPSWPPPSPRPSASWARRAGCCCVPPARSRWSGSWSRPPTASRPGGRGAPGRRGEVRAGLTPVQGPRPPGARTVRRGPRRGRTAAPA